MVPASLKGTASALANTPLGPILICANRKGIVTITFNSGHGTNSVHSDDIKKERDQVATSEMETANDHVNICLKWLEQYFNDPSKLKNVEFPELDLEPYTKKKFCIKVWQALKSQTQLGETVSYGKLAALCGSPRAARAVGLAMRTNPFPIVVPCHRVVTAASGIGNYSGCNGSITKKWLIDHECQFKLKQ